MPGKNCRFFVLLLLLLSCLSLVVFIPGASAAGSGSFFEAGIGGGISLNGINTKQVLLAPAYSIPIKNSEVFRVRIEGTVELSEFHDRITAIAGVSPFLRAVWPGARLRPFIEVGPGINYASRKHLDGKKLRGPVLFSAMGGVGLETQVQKRPVSFSYRVRHLSNGHIYGKENQGLDSQYLMLSIGF
ncbi:MAG: acyloxyacyl hydrolase [Nitrospirales bacterium]|nr:acyloxyacyl hydrolase [Nitrospirales bacterium]